MTLFPINNGLFHRFANHPHTQQSEIIIQCSRLLLWPKTEKSQQVQVLVATPGRCTCISSKCILPSAIQNFNEIWNWCFLSRRWVFGGGGFQDSFPVMPKLSYNSDIHLPLLRLKMCITTPSSGEGFNTDPGWVYETSNGMETGNFFLLWLISVVLEIQPREKGVHECVRAAGKSENKQVRGVCSLLPCGVQKSEGHEAWQQMPLPTELSS